MGNKNAIEKGAADKRQPLADLETPNKKRQKKTVFVADCELATHSLFLDGCGAWCRRTTRAKVMMSLSERLRPLVKAFRRKLDSHRWRVIIVSTKEDKVLIYKELLKDRMKLGWGVVLKELSPQASLRAGVPQRRKRVVNDSRQVVATYNVRGVRGKKDQLLEACANDAVSILCLQETLLTTTDWRLRLPGFEVLSDTAEGVGRRGVALAWKRAYNFIESEGITGNLIMASATNVEPNTKWSIGSLYVPCTGRGSGRREFLAKLRIFMSKRCWLDPGRPCLLGGDFNMGQEALARLLTRWGVPFRMLTVSGSPKTRRQGKAGHWTSLDHFVVNEAAMNRACHGNVKRGWDLSDHWPVLTRLRAAMPNSSVREKRKYNVTRIGEYTKQIAHHNMWETLLQLPDSENYLLGEKYAEVSEKIAESLERGKAAQPTQRGWHLNRSTKLKISRKREIFRRWHDAEESKHASAVTLKAEYMRLNDEVKTKIRDEKATRWANYVQKGIDALRGNRSKRLWAWLKNTAGLRRANLATTPIKNTQGKLLFDPESIASRWADHFEMLANDGTGHSLDRVHWADAFARRPERALDVNQDLEWLEIQSILRRMPNGKAGGGDGMPAEWLKAALGTDDFMSPKSSAGKVLFRLLTYMWEQSVIPKGWRAAVIIPLAKKGDLSDCDNYRGISLISVVVKLLTKVVVERVYTELESRNFFSKAQAGFRSREEAMAQVVALRELVDRRRGVGKATYVAFIDIRKAYDTVPIEALLRKLELAGVTGKALSFLRSLYLTSTARVRVGNTLSDEFTVRRGVRQGCPGSPALFNIFINDILEGVGKHGVSVPGITSTIPGFMFADDLVVVASNPNDLKAQLNALDFWAATNEMEFGNSKCGILGFHLPPGVDLSGHLWQLGGKNVPVVDSYVYLGVTLQGDFNLAPWVTEKRTAALAAFYTIYPIISSHSIPLRARVTLFRALVESRLRYGGEILGMKKQLIQPLQRVMSAGVKAMVGTRSSRNTVLALGPACMELSIPPLTATMAVARVRAYLKYQSLATHVADLLNLPTSVTSRYSWAKVTRGWMKRYNFDAESVSFKQLKTSIIDRIESRDASKTLSLLNYQKHHLRATSKFILATYSANHGKGLTWLIRHRLQAVWTSMRAAQARLIPASAKYKCSSCGLELVDEYSHILVSCLTFSKDRIESGLEPLIFAVVRMLTDSAEGLGPPAESDVFQFLSGGEVRGVNMFWSRGRRDIATQDPIKASDILQSVATFYGSMMGTHMGNLWANVIEEGRREKRKMIYT